MEVASGMVLEFQLSTRAGIPVKIGRKGFLSWLGLLAQSCDRFRKCFGYFQEDKLFEFCLNPNLKRICVGHSFK